MELKETNHNYYSSDGNYYLGNRNGENFGRFEYDTWKEFKEEWLYADGLTDCDLNLCFRYDIIKNRGEGADELIGVYRLWLFFILQKKGIYRPVLVRRLTDDDMGELEKFLKHQWDYMKEQWIEVQ